MKKQWIKSEWYMKSVLYFAQPEVAEFPRKVDWT